MPPASPLRKRSVHWSTSVPSLGANGSGSGNEDGDGDGARKAYREYPTPHPKKLAAVASYFVDDGSTDNAQDGGGSGSSENGSGGRGNAGHGPSTSESPAKRQPLSGSSVHGTRRAAVPAQGQQRDTAPARQQQRDAAQPEGPRPRPWLARRSSTMDSDYSTRFRNPLQLQRSLSMAEGGGKVRTRREGDRSGGGIVAELIRFGLRNGIGRGLQMPGTDTGNGGERERNKIFRVASTSTLYEKDPNADNEKDKAAGTGTGVARKPNYKEKCQMARERRASIVHHVEDYVVRQKFILRLAKALLSFGAPSHRIESQLLSASEIMGVTVSFVHLPNLIMVTFMDTDTRTSETRFVRAGGRVALTKLHKVHDVYRDVLHDKIGAAEGCERLKKIIQERPLYSILTRCMLAFFCASIICVLSFGGSIVDMFISGASASLLQYLGLNAASKSTMYANVYEISVSIVVSFLARALGTLSGNIFCYSAISSAGVVLILPGFTILIAALELTSRNILCGSVRMVYAIIYTLFLGFGLTIGSDFYLLVNPQARRILRAEDMMNSETLHGYVVNSNSSVPTTFLGATYTFVQTAASGQSHIIKGCYRDPSWPWYRQPLPWWTVVFLVPIYSTLSSIGNLQAIRSAQLPIMVIFSCLAYAANRAANYYISDHGDIVSAFGAFVIGLCGNLYSRIIGGTAFTSMITGVLFLVPSAIGSGGGLIQSYDSSAQRYSGSFELGIRMIKVAIGVTIGLFMAQIIVYSWGRRKSVAHFAF